MTKMRALVACLTLTSFHHWVTGLKANLIKWEKTEGRVIGREGRQRTLVSHKNEQSLEKRKKSSSHVTYLSRVTGYGKISPLWNNIISVLQSLDSLSSIWQNCEPTLVNFLCCWANIQCCKGPKIERIILPSGHTGRQATLLTKKTKKK